MPLPFNPVVVPLAGLGAVAFAVGFLLSRRVVSRRGVLIYAIVSSVLAVPWLLFALDYRYAVDIGAWFYEFRALSASELAAAAAGLLFGFIHRRIAGASWRSRIVVKWFFTLLFFAVLLSPYVNLVLSPVRYEDLSDRWSEGVCVQNSESTCGPCALATLLRLYGHRASEREMAREVYSDSGGTLPHHMLRALRRRGIPVRLIIHRGPPASIAYPSIATVKLPELADIKHFIVVLDRNGDSYTIGDPLLGRVRLSLQDMRREYKFAGVCFVTAD